MTLAQRIVEHVFSPDAPTDPDARVALVDDLLARAEPCPNCAEKDRLLLEIHEAMPACRLQEFQDASTLAVVNKTVQQMFWYQDRADAQRQRAEAAEAKLARAETPTPDHAALAREIADDLFINSSGDTASRLVMMSRIGRYLGGWSKAAMASRIEAALSRAEQAAPAAPTTEAVVYDEVDDPRTGEPLFIPRQPTPPPAAPCPSCGSTDGFHTMRNCPKLAAPSGEPDEAFDYGSILLDFRDGTSTLNETIGRLMQYRERLAAQPAPTVPPPLHPEVEEWLLLNGLARTETISLDELKARFAAAQPMVDLPEVAAKVLRENLWELYEGGPAIPPLSREVLDMAYGYCANQHVVGGHGPGLFEDCPRPICVEARATLAGATPPPPAPPPVLDPNRCAVCGWPLAESVEKGCTRGNCSHRPLPDRFYDTGRAAAEYGLAVLSGPGSDRFVTTFMAPPASEAKED